MNERQKRTLASLLTLVVVMAVVFGVVKAAGRWARQREEAEAAASQEETLDTVQVPYTSLSYRCGGTMLSFSMDGEAQWYWTNDPEFPLQQDAIEKIVSLVENMKPQQTITEGDTLEAYGLTEPAATLCLTASNGIKTEFSFGKTTTDGDSYYVLMNNVESPVYIIADTLYQAISVGIYDMMDLPEYPQIPEEDWQTLTLRCPAAEGEVPEIKTWDLSQGKGDGDSAALAELLAELKVDACVDYRPSDDAAAICGFGETDTPIKIALLYNDSDGQADISASREGETVRMLEIGGMTLDGEGYYIRVDEDTTIYRLAAQTVAPALQAAGQEPEPVSEPAA